MMARDNIAHDNVDPGLAEIEKERTLGGLGATKIREVPRIDFSDFKARKGEIADQLWQASTDIGFFQIVNHGIPQEQIDEAFAMTERFFALPHEIKAQYPLGKGTNAGWEYKSQVRPSTGTPDQKESYDEGPCRHLTASISALRRLAGPHSIEHRATAPTDQGAPYSRD